MILIVLGIVLSAAFFALYCVSRDPKQIVKDAAWVRKLIGLK